MKIEKERYRRLVKDVVKLDRVYKWLEPPGYGDFKLPLELSIDDIEDSEMCHESKFK